MANVYRVSVGGVVHNLSGLIPSGTATMSNNQFTGSFPGIVEYIDGIAIFLRNNIADSQSDCTLQINQLGFKPIFLSNNVSQRVSTEWKNGSSGLFIYDTSLNSGNGGWVFYSGVGGSSVSPSSTTPVMDGTASVGSETDFARGDHRHPSDTSKVSKSGDTMTGTLTCKNGTDYDTKQARNIFIISSSASLPSDGDNGDIALLY